MYLSVVRDGLFDILLRIRGQTGVDVSFSISFKNRLRWRQVGPVEYYEKR